MKTSEVGWERKSERERETWSRDGLLGRKCDMENAHTVEQGYNYNGSGDLAFGGASQWPVVSCRVSFVEGEERRAALFARQLRQLIDVEFGKSERVINDD